MATKKLIIVATALKSEVILESYHDILALSLISMESCKQQNIRYITPEDLYFRSEIRSDEIKFQNEVIQWMAISDKEFKNISGYDYSFSANGFWWMSRLEGLHYINKLASKIKAIYSEIIFDMPKDYIKVELPDVSFTTLQKLVPKVGLDYFVSYLALALGIDKTMNIYHINNNGNQISRFEKFKYLYLNRTFEIVKSKTKEYIKKKILNQSSVKKFWSIQRGYEVEELYKFQLGIKLCYPTDEVLKFISSNSEKKTSCEIKHSNESIKVLRLSLGALYDFFLKIQNQYLENVVQKVPILTNYILNQIGEQTPYGLLYSLGTGNLLEYIFADVANKKNIPVFFFKHSGIENIFLKESLINNFFEYNSLVKRTQFFHSKFEFPSQKNDLITPYVLPSLEKRIYKSTKTHHPPQIIYSMGPPSFWSFKDFFKIILDSERYSFIENLLDSINLFRLKIDIKVHPVEWESTFRYLELLSKRKHNFNILTGGSIERTLDNYNIAIVDIICTKVLSALFYTDINIIVYAPDGVELNEDLKNLLEKRVFLVKTFDDINNAIKQIIEKKHDKNFDEFNDIVKLNYSKSDIQKTLSKALFN